MVAVITSTVFAVRIVHRLLRLSKLREGVAVTSNINEVFFQLRTK